MSDPRPDLGRLRIDRNATDSAPRRALAWSLGLALVAVPVVTAAYLYLRGNQGINVQVISVEVSGGSGGSVGITANGYVVARTRASVSSRVSGRLARLLVEEGSRVRRGEVMAEQDNADYTAAVAQAVAESLRTVASLAEAHAARD